MQKIRVIDDVYFVSYRGNSRASLCYFLAVLMALNVAIRVTSVVVFVFALL